MAKKATVVEKPAINTYKVISPKVGKMLGPHRVQGEGSSRTVALTDKQAKYYLDQDVISA